MDRWVVRVKAKPREVKENKRDKRNLKQATIGTMKKVVPMKEVRVLADRMRKSKGDPDTLLECLSRLREKIFEPSVLVKLDIGRVVKRLARHPDKRVAKSAMDLMNDWKAKVVAPPKPLLEVKTGGKDETLRRGFRKLISDALVCHSTEKAQAKESLPWSSSSSSSSSVVGGREDVQEQCDAYALRIEKHIFKARQERRPGKAYKGSCRQVAWMFKYNPDATETALTQDVAPSCVVAAAEQWKTTGKVDFNGASSAV